MPDPSFRRFVLLCPQRSGSNALTSLLEQLDGVRLYGQLFNNGLEYRRYHRGDLDLPLFRPHPETRLHFGPTPPLRQRLERLALRFVERERSLDRYLDAFWSRWGGDDARWNGSRPRAVGFKLHDFQLVDRDLEQLFDQHLDRIVILWRRNLLKAAVSWAVAMRTGVWTQKTSQAGQSASPRPPHPLHLELGELAWFIDKTRRSVETWERLAAESSTPSLTITYEEHVLPKALDLLLEHLGLDASPDVEFGTRKLSSPRYEHVANARQIDETLGAPATGFLFDRRSEERDDPRSDPGASSPEP